MKTIVTTFLLFVYILSAAQLLPFYDAQKDKYGYANSEMEMIIPAQFDNAELFDCNNIAIVTEGKKKTFIHKDGQQIISFPAKKPMLYQSIKATHHFTNCNKRFLCFYKKEDNQDINSFQVYDSKLRQFISGEYIFENGELPTIDREFTILKTRNNLYSVLDTSGILLVTEKKDITRSMYFDSFLEVKEVNGEKKIVDLDSKNIFNYHENYSKFFPSGGLNKGMEIRTKSGNVGLLDSEFKLLCDTIFSKAAYLNSDFFYACKTKSCAVYNRDLEIVFDSINFYNVTLLVNNLIKAKRHDTNYILKQNDTSLEILLKADHIKYLIDKNQYVYTNIKEGVHNSILVDSKFKKIKDVLPFYGYYTDTNIYAYGKNTRVNNKKRNSTDLKGLATLDGKILTEIKYGRISRILNSGCPDLFFKTQNRINDTLYVSVINQNGQTIIPSSYKYDNFSVTKLHDGFYLTTYDDDELYTIYDLQGKLIESNVDKLNSSRMAISENKDGCLVDEFNKNLGFCDCQLGHAYTSPDQRIFKCTFGKIDSTLLFRNKEELKKPIFCKGRLNIFIKKNNKRFFLIKGKDGDRIINENFETVFTPPRGNIIKVSDYFIKTKDGNDIYLFDWAGKQLNNSPYIASRHRDLYAVSRKSPTNNKVDKQKEAFEEKYNIEFIDRSIEEEMSLREKQHYGLIDSLGNEIIEIKYNKVTRYDSMITAIKEDDNGDLTSHIFNTNGKEYYSGKFDAIYPKTIENQNYFIVYKNNLYGVLNDKFEELIPMDYYRININYGMFYCHAYGNVSKIFNAKKEEIDFINRKTQPIILRNSKYFFFFNKEESKLYKMDRGGTLVEIISTPETFYKKIRVKYSSGLGYFEKTILGYFQNGKKIYICDGDIFRK